MDQHAKLRLARFTRELKYAQKLVADMEAKMTAMEASSDAFSKAFARYRKVSQSLLDNAEKRLASEIKKISDADRT